MQNQVNPYAINIPQINEVNLHVTEDPYDGFYCFVQLQLFASHNTWPGTTCIIYISINFNYVSHFSRIRSQLKYFLRLNFICPFLNSENRETHLKPLSHLISVKSEFKICHKNLNFSTMGFSRSISIYMYTYIYPYIYIRMIQ